MSLINQMLKDLDARKDGESAIGRMPHEVRALPKSGSSPSPVIIAACLLLILAGGYGAYQWVAMRESPQPNAPAGAMVASADPVSAPPTPNVIPEPAQPAPQSGQLVEVPTKIIESQPSPHAFSLQMSETIAMPINPAEQVTNTEKAVSQGNEVGKAVSPVKAEKRVSDGQRSKEERLRPVPQEPVVSAAKGVSAKEDRSDRRPEGKAAPRIAITEPIATPKDIAEAEYRKSVSAFNQGRHDIAVEHLQRALRENSLHEASRQLLVRLLLESGRVDEAMRILGEGLQVQPQQIGWAMSLARLQVDRNDLQGAWKTLDQSLPAAGRSADYQGFAGYLLHRLGRFREAAVHYQSAINLASRDGRWWLGLGLALEAEGKPDQAREAFLNARQTGSLNKDLAILVEQKIH